MHLFISIIVAFFQRSFVSQFLVARHLFIDSPERHRYREQLASRYNDEIEISLTCSLSFSVLRTRTTLRVKDAEIISRLRIEG